MEQLVYSASSWLWQLAYQECAVSAGSTLQHCKLIREDIPCTAETQGRSCELVNIHD